MSEIMEESARTRSQVPAAKERVQHIWRHFGITLPANWEMLQYNSEFERGACLWADRYHYRCELSWRQVPGPPQMNRMLRDYMARLKEQKAATNLSRARVADWEGLTGRAGPNKFTHLSRHFPEEGCMLELVLLWPDKVEPELQTEIVRTVRAVPEEAGARRWKVFGLEVDAPHPLLATDIKPAFTRLEFGYENADWRGKQVFERRGLRAEWMTTPLDEWLKAQVPLKVRDRQVHEFSGHGAVGYHVHGQLPINMGLRVLRTVQRRKLGMLGHKEMGYHAAAWINPEDDRLYFLETRTDRDIDPAEVRRTLKNWE
jgi:hypothetical protein